MFGFGRKSADESTKTSPSTSEPTTSASSAPAAASSQAAPSSGGFSRKRCIKRKDAYFACLDDWDAQARSTNGGSPSPTVDCSAAKTSFDRDCLPSWVKHFEIQRFGAEVDAVAVTSVEDLAAGRVPGLGGASSSPSTNSDDGGTRAAAQGSQEQRTQFVGQVYQTRGETLEV